MGESWSTHSSPFAAPLLLSLLTAGAAGGCTASLDPGGGTTPDAGPDLPPLQQDLSQRSVPDSGPEINDATAPDAAADIAPKGYTRIKAGTFTMGCSPGDKQCCRFNCNWPFDQEKPHKVIISRDFWMKKGEVTQGQYQKMTGLNPSVFTGCGKSCPVENVTWWQTLAYCNLLSKSQGLIPCYYKDAAGTQVYTMNAANKRQNPYWIKRFNCRGYRLPTEAEWEYAARAGTTTPVYHGNGAATDGNIKAIAWYMKNSKCSWAGCEKENCRKSVNIGPSGTHPAAQRQPNAWGLFDMFGNVWEFVWDYYGEYHDGPVKDPSGPKA